MINNKTFYEILEVESTATQKEIKKSFRSLSKRYHPDISKIPNSEELFDEVTKAYEVLSNEDLREEYDRRLKSTQVNVGFNDIFSRFKEAKARTNGNDVHVNVLVSIETLSRAKAINFSYSKRTACRCADTQPSKICSRCRGTGKYLDTLDTMVGRVTKTKVCEECDGVGKIIQHEESCDKVTKTEKVTETIEVSDKVYGQPYRFVGKGDEGLNGGKNGDLIVEFSYNDAWAKAKSGYRLNENNEVFKEIEIDLVDIVNPKGFEVEMPSGEKVNVELNSERIGTPIYFANKAFGKLPTVLHFKIRIPEMTKKQQKQIYDILK